MAEAPGDDPPDPGKGGDWKPLPPDKQFLIPRKPLPFTKDKDVQKNNDDEPTSVGDALGTSLLTLPERDDHSNLQRSNSRASSGVSSLDLSEIDRLEEMRRRGIDSPVISLPSRPNSPGSPSISGRRSGLTLQTTMPSRPDLLHGIQEEPPKTPSTGTTKGGRMASPPSRPLEDTDRATLTGLQRQEKSRYSDSPYKEGSTSSARSPRSERSLRQQSEPGDVLESSIPGWVPDLARWRDTMRAGAESWVPAGYDIDSASGSVLTHADSRGLPERGEGLQQSYYDAAANPENASTTTIRPGSRSNPGTRGASIVPVDRRASDGTAITPSSHARSRATTYTGRPQTEGDSSSFLIQPRAPVPTAPVESMRGREPHWYGSQEGRRQSDVPRMPVRDCSTSSVEGESCSELLCRILRPRPRN